MKKALVLLLLLAMLAPMALVQPAGAAVEKEPFYSLAWYTVDTEKYPYVEYLVTSSFTNFGGTAILGYGNNKMYYGSYTDEDVTALATALTEELKSRPAGKRYWHLGGPSTILKLAPEDVLFLEDGVTQLRDLTSAVMKKMKELGAPLDGVVIDTEFVAMGAWYLQGNSGNQSIDWYAQNPNLYAEIVANPKYKKLIRPLLEKYGFPFYPNPSGQKSEIFTIYSLCGYPELYRKAYDIWNMVMNIHIHNYSDQWLYEPLQEYFPDATCSDYHAYDSSTWEKITVVNDDGVVISAGNGTRVGDVSTKSYYHNNPGYSQYQSLTQYASFNDAVYEQSPFNSLLYEVNFTRHMYASTDTKMIGPWIAPYLYRRDKNCPWGESAYYSELIYHLGMFDPEPFLAYFWPGDLGNDDVKWDKCVNTLNALMEALTEIAGYADREPIEMPQYWNAEYIVSGMYCGGRNLWRITPNTDEVSLKNFKVDGKDPTFSVKGQTITFPGGKILKDATIPNVGSTGYWVETKAGVNPVMTSDADRYAKYPSYEENFNSYANGALTADKMAQTYAWEFTGSVKAANKALSLTGTTLVKNVTIPGKITAGDSYAKNQTWEITFTLPSGLSDNAEICLLQYEGTGASDSGIRIKGGKIYFDEIGVGTTTTQELASISPGTYTLKRVMDFTDSNNFSYDLYLLDSKGKEITNTKNIGCPAFSTIKSINFSTTNAGKAVLLDDYKLYPSGLAADFELYDADTGKNLADNEIDKARDSSTAYRLSWLNGSSSSRTVTVVAATYENGNLKSEKAVKTLTMKPGHDGVVTGVVDVKTGQRVHVYLKSGSHQDVTYTEPGATESGNKLEQTGSSKATKATSATGSATNATASSSKVTKVTKVPTRATKVTAATTPGQTQSAGETVAPEETVDVLAPDATTETFAPEETLAPDATAETSAPIDENEGEDKGVSLWIIVIAAVAALAVAGGLTFFLLKKKKPAAVPPAETPDEPEEIEDLNADPEA